MSTIYLSRVLMLDQEIKFYLKTHVGKPTIDFRLSDEESDRLFAYLNENSETVDLQDTQSQLIIKQAFKEYLEPVGYILFKIINNRIRLKVFAYKIEPKDSVNLPSVLEILKNNQDIIEYDYKGNKNQISLPKKLKDKIYRYINKIDNEEINKKELARFAVNEFFKLHDHDIVIIRDEHIFVKKLDEKYKRKVAEDEKETIANRYNGINEEDFRVLYDDFFLEVESKNFFYYSAKMFVQTYLLEKKIDNHMYEKKVFALIQSIILEQLKDAYEDEDEDFFLGFSGYIFRKHFEEVFGHIANLILEEIAISNQYMMEFLKYYSLNVIVVDGRKYKVPELETEDGLKWNVISMLSIVKIYIKMKTSVEALKKEKEDINKKIKSLYIGDKSPSDYQNEVNKEKERLTEKINENGKKLERYLDSLNLIKDTTKKNRLQVDIYNIKDEIKKYRDEKKKVTATAVGRTVITEYNSSRKNLDNITRQLRREEKILEQNKASYVSIKNTLAKALVSKKMLVP